MYTYRTIYDNDSIELLPQMGWLLPEKLYQMAI